jgi:hypothetical protein
MPLLPAPLTLLLITPLLFSAYASFSTLILLLLIITPPFSLLITPLPLMPMPLIIAPHLLIIIDIDYFHC